MRASELEGPVNLNGSLCQVVGKKMIDRPSPGTYGGECLDEGCCPLLMNTCYHPTGPWNVRRIRLGTLNLQQWACEKVGFMRVK